MEQTELLDKSSASRDGRRADGSSVIRKEWIAQQLIESHTADARFDNPVPNESPPTSNEDPKHVDSSLSDEMIMYSRDSSELVLQPNIPRPPSSESEQFENVNSASGSGPDSRASTSGSAEDGVANVGPKAKRPRLAQTSQAEATQHVFENGDFQNKIVCARIGSSTATMQTSADSRDNDVEASPVPIQAVAANHFLNNDMGLGDHDLSLDLCDSGSSGDFNFGMTAAVATSRNAQQRIQNAVCQVSSFDLPASRSEACIPLSKHIPEKTRTSFQCQNSSNRSSHSESAAPMTASPSRQCPTVGSRKQPKSQSPNSSRDHVYPQVPLYGGMCVNSDRNLSRGSAVATTAVTAPLPKRPLNAFNLFASIQREELKDLLPSTDLKSTNKHIGKLWKELSQDEREKYRNISEEKNREFSVQMENMNILQDITAADDASRIPLRIKTVKPNAYNEFLATRTPEIREQNPSMDFREIMRILSDEWKCLSEEEKEKFRESSMEKARARRVRRIEVAQKKMCEDRERRSQHVYQRQEQFALDYQLAAAAAVAETAGGSAAMHPFSTASSIQLDGTSRDRFGSSEGSWMHSDSQRHHAAPMFPNRQLQDGFASLGSRVSEFRHRPGAQSFQVVVDSSGGSKTTSIPQDGAQPNASNALNAATNALASSLSVAYGLWPQFNSSLASTLSLPELANKPSLMSNIPGFPMISTVTPDQQTQNFAGTASFSSLVQMQSQAVENQQFPVWSASFGTSGSLQSLNQSAVSHSGKAMPNMQMFNAPFGASFAMALPSTQDAHSHHFGHSNSNANSSSLNPANVDDHLSFSNSFSCGMGSGPFYTNLQQFAGYPSSSLPFSGAPDITGTSSSFTSTSNGGGGGSAAAPSFPACSVHPSYDTPASGNSIPHARPY
eukprot:ANDGO_06183.mRNA.1 hypothetical protein GUITHDRAFT_153133